jgi:hypothetical protein
MLLASTALLWLSSEQVAVARAPVSFLFPLKHAHTQRAHAKAAPLIFCSAPITALDTPFLTAELLALPDGAYVLTRFERCGFCREAEQPLAGPAQHLRNGDSSWHGTDAEKWLLCV